jgi:hypothetical protein
MEIEGNKGKKRAEILLSSFQTKWKKKCTGKLDGLAG